MSKPNSIIDDGTVKALVPTENGLKMAPLSNAFEPLSRCERVNPRDAISMRQTAMNASIKPGLTIASVIRSISESGIFSAVDAVGQTKPTKETTS